MYRSASLKSKLLLSSVLLVTAVLLALGVYDYGTQRARLRAAQTAVLDAIAARLSGSLVGPLWEFSNDQARAVLTPEMSQADVQAIVVRGTDGRVFAAIARKDGKPVGVAEAPAPASGWQARDVEVLREGKPVGSVSVVYGEDELQERLREQFLRSIVQIVLVDACLIAVLLVMSRWWRRRCARWRSAPRRPPPARRS